MSKQGFRVFDSDMHIMEPPDLWERYIDPEFTEIAPLGGTTENVRDLRIRFPADQSDGGTLRLPHRDHIFERNQALNGEDLLQSLTGEWQLDVMDVEGL